MLGAANMTKNLLFLTLITVFDINFTYYTINFNYRALRLRNLLLASRIPGHLCPRRITSISTI